MKTILMKIVPIFAAAFIFAITSTLALGEGIASMDTITPQNQETLKFHEDFGVKLGLRGGTTVVKLYIQTDKEHPLVVCDVTIYAFDRKNAPILANSPILADFSLRTGSFPLSFELANDLVDRVKVRYHLRPADGTPRSHVFDIEPGQLRKLKGPGKPNREG